MMNEVGSAWVMLWAQFKRDNLHKGGIEGVFGAGLCLPRFQWGAWVEGSRNVWG